MKLKKKCQLKKIKKKIESTRQTRDTGYETELTIYKANHNKL
jgi:hypothetical protein